VNKLVLVQKCKALKYFKTPIFDDDQSWQPNLSEILPDVAGCDQLCHQHNLRQSTDDLVFVLARLEVKPAKGFLEIGLGTLVVAYVMRLTILEVVVVYIQNVLVPDVHQVVEHLRYRTNLLFRGQLQRVRAPGHLAPRVVVEPEVDGPVRTFSDQMISFSVLHSFDLPVCTLGLNQVGFVDPQAVEISNHA
jgi:hypothetical protein